MPPRPSGQTDSCRLCSETSDPECRSSQPNASSVAVCVVERGVGPALLLQLRGWPVGSPWVAPSLDASARAEDRAVTGEAHTLVPEPSELARFLGREPVRPPLEQHRDAPVEVVTRARSHVLAEKGVLDRVLRHHGSWRGWPAAAPAKRGSLRALTGTHGGVPR